MSLSEAPKVKITHTTSEEICDEIWAGAFEYAKAAGYSLNPLVLMMLWSALLLTAKNELDKHDIFNDVQQKFARSFSKIYDVGIDQVELLADIKGRMQQFYAIISEEIGQLDSELDIYIFLELVENTNEAYFENCKGSLRERVHLFSTVKSLLSSHIYDILRDIDNPVMLQFEKTTHVNTHTNAPSAQPISPASTSHSQQKPTVQHSKSEKSGLPLAVWFLIVFALVVCLLVAIIYCAGGYDDILQEPKPTVSAMQQLDRPRSGTILYGFEAWDSSEITVTADGSNDYVVLLKDEQLEDRLVFYVRAGDTVTVGVPTDCFFVYFASGDKWYGFGKGRMFGEDTSYSKDDDLRDFIHYTWEYTLYPVSNGNFSETPINESEFF